MTEPFAAGRRWRGPGRIVGEFLIIVVGVLVALTADSWSERRSESRLADTYVEQLRSDIGQNQTLVAEALSGQRTSYQSVVAIVEARGRGERLSSDSMRVLIGQRRLLKQRSSMV